MEDNTELKRTPLHTAHVKAGARMVPFVGWDLPILYTSIIDEHLAVRNAAGLFDVSHMGEASVRGSQALEFLQKVTCNNVARLKTGRAHYTGLMLENGAFVDDLLIYHLGVEDYMLVLNAANTAKDLAYLHEYAAEFDVQVEDVSARWSQMAIQGPRSLEILQTLFEENLSEMKYYAFSLSEIEGVRCIISRTGYTGEDGFEIYAPWEKAEKIWYSILTAGGPRGLVPVGLGARDTLRLEAKMALYGNDIDENTTAFEADLGWIVKLKKGDFIGCDVLAAQKEQGVSRKLIGFEMEGRAIARHGYTVFSNGEPVGKVTSGTHAPHLGKNIGMAYLPAGMWEPGTRFEIEIRSKRAVAVVVETPFYKRKQ